MTDTPTLTPLTTTQAADYLTKHGLPMHARTVARRIDRGELPAMRTPDGRRLIKRSALDAYIAHMT
jgi:excisionase family DNA binding protein